MTSLCRNLQRLALAACLVSAGAGWGAEPNGPGPASWAGDLTPIGPQDWSYERAAHLLERAGFGGTPEEIQRLADMTPAQAVRRLVHYQSVDNGRPAAVRAFGHPRSRTRTLPAQPARRHRPRQGDQGEALGVKVKPAGNRPLQPVVEQVLLLAARERARDQPRRLLVGEPHAHQRRPLQEKMALFWHGHFATNEDKVRDYRKMLRQLDLFQAQGTGNFRDLMVGVAQDPAMLSFLDAGVNVKGAPNENFAREIMELFTMGVGNYTEKDIREAARAFTGWNYVDLNFVVNRTSTTTA